MKRKFLMVAGLLAVVILTVMMNLTTPQSVGPFGVLVFFTLFYTVCFGLAVGFVKLVFWGAGKVGRERRSAERKIYYYGAVLAFAPVILLATGSFGGISGLEVTLVIALMLLGVFVVAKRL